MSNTNVTARVHRRGVYVLVVHDEKVDVQALVEALGEEFIVRTATTAFDILERLAGVTLTCVVCVLGGAMRAKDFFELVTRAAPNQAARLVFVATQSPTGDEEAFLGRMGVNWTSSFDRPEEVATIVRAVSARR